MIEVNKPIDTSPNTKCFKCKSEFYVHPMTNKNSDFITDCNLHCTHDKELIQTKGEPMHFELVCKKCDNESK